MSVMSSAYQPAFGGRRAVTRESDRRAMRHGDTGHAADRLPWKGGWFLTGAVAASLIVGMAVRLYNVTGSLWLDEFSTLWAVEGDLPTVSQRVISFQGQTPLYYWVAWAAVHSLGE